MEKIKLLSSDTIYNCKLNSIKVGVFKISIDAPTSLSHEIFSDGFYLLNEHNNSVMGNYSDYTVLYKESEENENNVFYISNGEVYIEHDTNTDVGNDSSDTQVELTPEELEQQKLEKFIRVKQSKIEELRNICQEKIEDGVYVDNKKYSYTIQDQSNILNAMNLAKETGLEVPYHADDEPCTLYDYSTIASIYMQQQMNLTENQTYFNQLKQYISSINDVEQTDDIIAIVYGQELTGEYLDTYNTIITQSQKILEQLILSESLNVSKESQ